MTHIPGRINSDKRRTYTGTRSGRIKTRSIGRDDRADHAITCISAHNAYVARVHKSFRHKQFAGLEYDLNNL